MTEVFADPLALAIDARVLALDPCPDPARLFGVRLRGDEFALVPFWSGAAREIPLSLVPPDGCAAIALESVGWAAPLDDGAAVVRPSQHPMRRRMHQTCVVYGDDGVDVTVLRQNGDPPQVMRGGIGYVLDRMRVCWANRRGPARVDGGTHAS